MERIVQVRFRGLAQRRGRISVVQHGFGKQSSYPNRCVDQWRFSCRNAWERYHCFWSEPPKGHVMSVHMTYDGTTVTWTITDSTAGKSFIKSVTINIPSFTGSTAYLGFERPET